MSIYPGGLRGDAKIAFFQSDAIALAFDAGLGGAYGESTNQGFDESSIDSHYWADGTLLLTARIAPGTDLNVAARFLRGETYAKNEDVDFDGNRTTNRYSTQYDSVGGALGFAFRRSTCTVSPEIAFYQVKSRDTESDFVSEPAFVIVPTLGFSIGFQ